MSHASRSAGLCAVIAWLLQVDVWVMLADPLGYVLDSKPYLAPILTPYEALLALTVRARVHARTSLLVFGQVDRQA